MNNISFGLLPYGSNSIPEEIGRPGLYFLSPFSSAKNPSHTVGKPVLILR